jgi:hypothetical protein
MALELLKQLTRLLNCEGWPGPVDPELLWYFSFKRHAQVVLGVMTGRVVRTLPAIS